MGENPPQIVSRADDIALLVQAWGEAWLTGPDWEEDLDVLRLDELANYDPEDVFYNSAPLTQPGYQNQSSIEVHAENLGIDYSPFLGDPEAAAAHAILLQAGMMLQGANEDKIYIWSDAACSEGIVSGLRLGSGSIMSWLQLSFMQKRMAR